MRKISPYCWSGEWRKGALSQGTQSASRNWKRQRNRISPRSYKSPADILIWPVKSILDFWSPDCKITHLSVKAFHRHSVMADPMDCSTPGSSVHRIFQARILVVISFSRGSSWPRDRTCISCISCIVRWILYHWATCDLRCWACSCLFQKQEEANTLALQGHITEEHPGTVTTYRVYSDFLGEPGQKENVTWQVREEEDDRAWTVILSTKVESQGNLVQRQITR